MIVDLLVHSYLTGRSYLLNPSYVDYTRIGRWVRSAPHLHPVYHFTCILEGKGFLETDSGLHRLTPGDVVTINPGEKHIFSAGEESLYYFTFNFHLATMNVLSHLDLTRPIESRDIEPVAATNRIQELLPLRVEAARIQYPRSRWPDAARLIEWYASMPEPKRRARDAGVRFFLDLLGLLCDPQPESPADPFIRKALDYLDAHILETFSLRKMAAEFYLAPAYLCSRFREKTGTALGDTFRKRKIMKACELLSRTEKSITEIAYQLSFSSSQHFSSAFKSAKGKTPREYRQVLEPQ